MSPRTGGRKSCDLGLAATAWSIITFSNASSAEARSAAVQYDVFAVVPAKGAPAQQVQAAGEAFAEIAG